MVSKTGFRIQESITHREVVNTLWPYPKMVPIIIYAKKECDFLKCLFFKNRNKNTCEKKLILKLFLFESNKN